MCVEDRWSLEYPGTCKYLLELHGSHLLTLKTGVVSAETLVHTACAYVGRLISLYSRRTRCARAGQETRTIQTRHVGHGTPYRNHPEGQGCSAEMLC